MPNVKVITENHCPFCGGGALRYKLKLPVLKVLQMLGL
jgi:hypothetical protein